MILGRQAEIEQMDGTRVGRDKAECGWWIKSRFI